MNDEMIVCVPGTWESREDFLVAIVTITGGEFMFLGGILWHARGKDHIELEFDEPNDKMGKAFSYAGRGGLSDETLNKITSHKSVVYLFFPLDIASQRLHLVKFTEVISRCGGIAVKIENSGIAHEWGRRFSRIA
jgi:hypothetical protein